MPETSRHFRRRLAALITLLVAALLTCGTLALIAARDAARTLNRLADLELEAAKLARDFRQDVDDIQGALLRVGTDSADGNAALIQQRQKKLSAWVEQRLVDADSAEERKILQQLAVEVRSYFLKLEDLAERTGGYSTRLDRDTVVMFDDSTDRLQSIADDFAAVHDHELRDLLTTSLGTVLWLRNLVFICLALLVATLSVMVAMLYRDVVRPLRTKLFQSESLLLQREKLAALGTLAAGVAHEIRNPLTAIKARLYTLRRAVIDPAAREDAQAIARELDRLERIVRDILGYARPSDPSLQVVELAAWLREFEVFIAPELRATGIDLTLESKGSISATVDPEQLRQVMLNLVRNAQEAFSGQPGRITLGLEREQSMLHGRPADIAVLSVTDNGPGIPAAVQARLFDPFFTTKAAGTGLGLSIVGRLVEQHGGEISFQSAPKAGTRFSVRLPLSDRSAQTKLA